MLQILGVFLTNNHDFTVSLSAFQPTLDFHDVIDVDCCLLGKVITFLKETVVMLHSHDCLINKRLSPFSDDNGDVNSTVE